MSHATLWPCRTCGQQIATSALSCPHCGAPTAVAIDRRSNQAFLLVCAGVLAVIGIVFFGNFRVVSGTPSMLVRREAFGFSDTFAAVTTCTSGPWISVMSTHGPLCHDLQRAGFLESDADRETRARADLQREYERTMREVQKQTEEQLRAIQRSISR